MNIFEYAVKNKVRFDFMGSLYTEDLWDLKVEQLDSIYKKLNSKKKKSNEESLLNTESNVDKELEIKIDIVKHIVEAKLDEKKASLKEAENKAKKQKIMALIKEKEDDSLKGMEKEELEKMLAEL